MSYNTRHQNTRNSGRYNRGGFVPGGTLRPGAGGGAASRLAAAVATASAPHAPSANHQTFEVKPMTVPPQPPQPPPLPTSTPDYEQAYDNSIKSEDVAMAPAPLPASAPPAAADGDDSSQASARQGPGFKIRLAGVKKISNKERRRRQNQLLRRLATPKNALMCINEMMPHDQVANHFKVEPAPAAADSLYFNNGTHNFCAELTLGGVSYKGFGENKLAARNAAAEHAIRDLMLKKMEKFSEMARAAQPEPGAGGADDAGASLATEDAEEDPLPMIQLLSFALHKLFSEWEGTGHRVPMLQRQRQPSQGPLAMDEDMRTAPAAATGAPGAPGAGGKAASKKVPKPVPANAASMHPAMLLTILRPQAAYRELDHEGDKPQNMVFTMAVDVDDQTYTGRAPNKKEARKNAARAACKAILGIVFDDERVGGAAPTPGSIPNLAKS